MKHFLKQALLLSIIINTTPAMSGNFELGVAASNNQSVITQKENDNDFAPVINYQGEKISMQYGTLSYQLYKSEGWLAQLVGEGRSAGYKASDSKVLSGMSKREDSFDAGIQLAHGGNWGVVQLKLLKDITNTHQGVETSLAYAHPREQGRWIFEPAVGLKVQSKDLVNYYYGVKNTESTIDRKAYTADSTIIGFTEFSMAYKVSRKWMIIGGLEYERFAKEITSSPIVDKDFQLTTFTALIYKY